MAAMAEEPDSGWRPLPGDRMAMLLAHQASARTVVDPDASQPALGAGRRTALLLALAGLAAFPFLLPWLGFSITAFLFGVVLMLMLWPRLTPARIAGTVVAAAILSIGSEILFGRVFGVVFPAASLFGG